MLFLFFVATLFITISFAAAIALANTSGERQPVRNRSRR